jgi:hypothetical protein
MIEAVLLKLIGLHTVSAEAYDAGDFTRLTEIKQWMRSRDQTG